MQPSLIVLTKVIILAVWTIGSRGVDVIPVTEELKSLLLDEHNNYRAAQKASNMQELVWDDALAQEAADWAKSCQFEHKNKGKGENLAFDSNKMSDSELITNAVKAWYDEIRMYRGPGCGPSSCHYTQVVWAETDKFGCGMVRCPYLYAFGMPVKDGWYLACFYTPKGNDISKYPFHSGPPCSECLQGQSCTNQGLCHGKGKKQCVNSESDKKCEEWSGLGQCKINKAYMEANCAKSCGVCEGGETSTDGGDCTDKNSECKTWADRGECRVNPQYMSTHCPLSCNICR